MSVRMEVSNCNMRGGDWAARTVEEWNRAAVERSGVEVNQNPCNAGLLQ
jgi:hypothetical protein